MGVFQQRPVLTSWEASLVQGPSGCLSFPSLAQPQEVDLISLQRPQEGDQDINKTPAITRVQVEISVAHPPCPPPGQEKGSVHINWALFWLLVWQNPSLKLIGH